MKIQSIFFGVLLVAISITTNLCAEQNAIDDPTSLQISDSTFSYSKADGQSTITTIGTIKNQSRNGFDELVVEVKYFDNTKKMIDTVTQPLYGVVVPPSQEVRFRVRDAADKPKDSYISSTVRVVSAEQRTEHQSNAKKNSAKWLEIFVSWLPMLLLIVVWIYFYKKMNRRDSPPKQTILLIEKQNDILSKQLEAIERIAAAAEKSTSNGNV